MPINVATGFADDDIFTASGGQPANISRAALAADAAFQVYAVPPGGATDEVLTKDSNADYDVSWKPAAGGGGSVSDWGDLGGTITDQTDLVAYVANFPIICKWTGAAWQTLSGGTVPTTATLVRWYDSTDDAGATAPTHYNVHDKWFGIT